MSSRLVGVGVWIGAMVLALTLLASSASALPPPVVVASGLDSPRHLTFSADGELYVAEAGRGGPRPGGPEPANCVGHPLGLRAGGGRQQQPRQSRHQHPVVRGGPGDGEPPDRGGEGGRFG